MLRCVREACGLPVIYQAKMASIYVLEYTTNVVENANSQIKSWCDAKLPIDQFINNLKELVDAQEYSLVCWKPYRKLPTIVLQKSLQILKSTDFLIYNVSNRRSS